MSQASYNPYPRSSLVELILAPIMRAYVDDKDRFAADAAKEGLPLGIYVATLAANVVAASGPHLLRDHLNLQQGGSGWAPWMGEPPPKKPLQLVP